MEVAALSLLLFHQTGVLNPVIDVLVPLYTFAVVAFIYTVHNQQKRLSTGALQSDDFLFDTGNGGPVQLAAGDQEEEDEGTGAGDGVRPDFTGVWKSVPSKNVNYEEFLSFQGVPLLKRKIANSSVITHTIQHEGNTVKLDVQPLDMQTTFHIDGQATVSYIGKKAFEDKMTWGPKGELVLVKRNKEDGTEITAIRSLRGAKDKKTLVMHQTARNKDGKEVSAVQTFEK